MPCEMERDIDAGLIVAWIDGKYRNRLSGRQERHCISDRSTGLLARVPGSGPRSGGLTTMIADPKKSESKAKTIAGQLPNRLPMRDSALGAASGLCTEARGCILSPNHEIALFEIPAALRPRADDMSPESIDVCSRKSHLNQPTAKGARRLVGS